MCKATDARIQAMGRWLNPDSIKIYARMTKEEYALWVDKLMAVRRIDTARTTSLPVMDLADAIAAFGSQLHVTGSKNLEQWGDAQPTATSKVPKAPLRSGERVSIYWTEMKEWYSGTFKCSRIEDSDDGGKQRACCIVYDAVGKEASLSDADRTFWHCLDDELWKA